MTFLLLISLTAAPLTYEGQQIIYQGPNALHECLTAAEAIYEQHGIEIECEAQL